MSENAALHRSLRLLAHPAVLGSLALVLLNDALLKPLYPSWSTGKLSDLGALAAAPVLLAGLLSLLLPRRLPHREAWVGGLSLGLVLISFILLKLTPAANAWVLTLARTAGFPLRAVADPSDLLTLPALIVPAWLWQKNKKLQTETHLSCISQRKAPSRLERRSPEGEGKNSLPFRGGWRGLRAGRGDPQPSALSSSLLILLSALILLADTAAPDYGITCLSFASNHIVAQAGYNSHFASSDGGLTWTLLNDSAVTDCPQKQNGIVENLVGPAGVKYRVTIGKSVERSTNNSTWQMVYQPVALTQAENFYQLKVRPGNAAYLPGPLDALSDPASGNLILAMGLDGVLVIAPGAEPVWVDVVSYHHQDLAADGFAGVLTLLDMEWLLAVIAAGLWLVTVTQRRHFAIWYAILTGIGWLFFAFTLLAIYPPIATGSEIAAFSGLTFLATAVWAIILFVIGLIRQWNHGLKLFLWVALISLLVGLLFFAPYLLWGYSIIADYWVAAGSAAALLLALTILGLYRVPKH